MVVLYIYVYVCVYIYIYIYACMYIYIYITCATMVVAPPWLYHVVLSHCVNIYHHMVYYISYVILYIHCNSYWYIIYHMLSYVMFKHILYITLFIHYGGGWAHRRVLRARLADLRARVMRPYSYGQAHQAIMHSSIIYYIT